VTFANYLFSSQLSNFLAINAGVSQSSSELSGARNALLVKSGALFSTFVDENQPWLDVNHQLFTTLETKSSGCFCLIGSHRVLVNTFLWIGHEG
jgi:hypothetical protein